MRSHKTTRRTLACRTIIKDPEFKPQDTCASETHHPRNAEGFRGLRSATERKHTVHVPPTQMGWSVRGPCVV